MSTIGQQIQKNCTSKQKQTNLCKNSKRGEFLFHPQNGYRHDFMSWDLSGQIRVSLATTVQLLI